MSFSKLSPARLTEANWNLLNEWWAIQKKSWGSKEGGDDQLEGKDPDSVSLLGSAAVDLRQVLRGEKRTAMYLKM